MERPARVLLVVDDEEDILVALSMYLEEGVPGLRVETAGSGRQGLERLAKGGVDMVLSDFRMPGMDGVEFLRQVHELAPDARCMMFTAFPDLDLVVRALDEGRIIQFLTKPLNPADVKRVVSEILHEIEASS